VSSRTDVPDLIVLGRARDLEGRQYEHVASRAFLVLLVLVPILALANVFGQRPATTAADSAAAKLTVSAPTTVRGGLLFQARLHIDAHRDVKKAVLVFGTGWLEGMTLNTIEPSPLGQGSSDGHLTFDLGHIAAGRSYVLYLQFQVDPTNIGHRSQAVTLYDGSTELLAIHRKVTVLP
jgi:hypothetical protein